MSTTTRTHVTDVFAVPVRSAEVARVDEAACQPIDPPVREAFRIFRTAPDLDDPTRAHLQELIDEHTHHLCVCSPNREDMLAARAEMLAHPAWAQYKARRDAAMGRHAR